MRRTKAIVLVLACLASAVAAAAASARSADVRLSLVAYSTPRDAYAELISQFEKTAAGKDVSFSQSYAASGEQARGQGRSQGRRRRTFPRARHGRAVKAGIVDAKWNRQSYRGMVTQSVVVFVVRDGNPKKIFGWNDLLKPGVEVVTPNPFTSGGARWNVMAAYGAQPAGQDRQAGAGQPVEAVQERRRTGQERASRCRPSPAARATCSSRTRTRRSSPAPRPERTVPHPAVDNLIENPIAVSKASEHKTEANAFLRFLRTPATQRVFARNGYRPVNKAVAGEFKSAFPTRPGLFTIDQLGLGGWGKVQTRFFDPDRGVMARIERQVGGSTG